MCCFMRVLKVPMLSANYKHEETTKIMAPLQPVLGLRGAHMVHGMEVNEF